MDDENEADSGLEVELILVVAAEERLALLSEATIREAELWDWTEK